MTKFHWVLLLPLAAGCASNESLETMQALKGTQVETVFSEHTGHRYQILVRPPVSIETGGRAYPVIYLLDGGSMFPQLAEYYHYLRLGDEVPEAFIVGISYGSDRFAEGNFRASDFTAPADSASHWGDAPKFARFLAEELLPSIESRYPVRADQRILFGQSLGGQFVLHSAFLQPDLFHGHIASNPALHRNLDFFLDHIPQSDETGGHLVISIGELDYERFANPASALTEALQRSDRTPWQFGILNLAGQTHFSAAPETFRQGLKAIFSIE